jgi:hypothetical protein
METVIIHILRIILRMVPVEWLKKLILKSIPQAAEMLLHREQATLNENETDYIYFIVPRKDETGKGKLLFYVATANLKKQPREINRILYAENLEKKIEAQDFEQLRDKLRKAIKDGSIEDGIKHLELK